MTHVSGLWRLDAFLDRDRSCSADQRMALALWVFGLQADPLEPPSVEVRDSQHRSVRVALLDEVGVAVTYRLMATGTPRLLRIERLP